MRFVFIVLFGAAALAGCMPTEPSESVAAVAAQPVATAPAIAAKPSPARVSSASGPVVAFAPNSATRSNPDDGSIASRSLGAVVADAEEVDDELEKQAASRPPRRRAGVQVVANAPVDQRAQVRIVALNSSTTPALSVAQPSHSAQTTSQPGVAQRSGDPQRYVATDDDVNIGCFPPALRDALNQIADHYGQQVQVTSGYRNYGRAHSMHRYCMAADIRVPGVGPRELAAYAKTVDNINGVGTYRYNTVTHVDVRQDKIAWRY